MSASTSTVFHATNAGHTCEVRMISERKSPRFEIVFDGALDQTIVATAAWRAEQKAAISAARAKLGLPEPVVVPAAPAAPRVWAAGGRRLARMAALWAEIARESGATDDPAELLRLGREHAEHWATLGREPFNREMDRLISEANEFCTRWDRAERTKVTFY